jgi:hypothetical protein
MHVTIIRYRAQGSTGYIDVGATSVDYAFGSILRASKQEVVPSRAEAIRRLVELGLKAKGK